MLCRSSRLRNATLIGAQPVPLVYNRICKWPSTASKASKGDEENERSAYKLVEMYLSSTSLSHSSGPARLIELSTVSI